MKIIESIYDKEKLNEKLKNEKLDIFDFLILFVATKNNIVEKNDIIVKKLNEFITDNVNLVSQLLKMSSTKEMTDIFGDNNSVVSKLYEMKDTLKSEEEQKSIIDLAKKNKIDTSKLKIITKEDIEKEITQNEINLFKRKRIDEYKAEEEPFLDYLLSSQTIIENDIKGEKFFNKELFNYRKKLCLTQIKASSEKSESLSCLINYLIVDICMKINKVNDLLIETDYERLKKVDLKTFSDVETPEDLKKKIGLDKVKKGIYVLTENNEIIVYGRKVGDVRILVYHTDLAKMKKIKTGGEIFINDKNEIVCVTNGSGHYIPPLETLKFIREQLITEKFDISKTVFCDVSFKNDFKISSELSLVIKKDNVLKNIINSRLSQSTNTKAVSFKQ